MPTATVATKPIESSPGSSARPRYPAMMPMTMAAMISPTMVGGPFRGWGPAGVTPDRPPSCVRMRTAPKWEVKRPTSKVSMSSDDPVILTCAISGAVANRDQCPAIPYTPQEYAAEARRIVDEGGVMIHIHARRPDGTPSYEVEDFRAITEAIRAELGSDDVIINYSTGAVGVPLAKRIDYLRELRPDVAALNMGSMNYAKYSQSRKAFVFSTVFSNPFEEIVELLEAMNELQVRPGCRGLGS